MTKQDNRPEDADARVLAQARLGLSPTEAQLSALFERLSLGLEAGSAEPVPGHNLEDTVNAPRQFSMKVLAASSAASLLVGLGLGFSGAQSLVRDGDRAKEPSKEHQTLVAQPEEREELAAERIVSETPAEETHSPTQTVPAIPRAQQKKPEGAELAPYDELTAVRNAQSALRSGDAIRALGLMKELRERTAGGGLLAERGVIEVLALCELGRVDEARGFADERRMRSSEFAYARRLSGSCVADEASSPRSE